jgi:hypothetical protein
MEEVDLLFENAGDPKPVPEIEDEYEDKDQVNQNVEKVVDVITEDSDDDSDQYTLDKFLESVNKKKTEIQFPKLNGVVDLKGLDKFPNLKTLFFENGFITRIINIPPTIIRIEAPYNTIKIIDELPESLEVLNVSHNEIKKIELGNVTSLKKLNISYNKIEKLDRIPRSLDTLKCEFNKIRELDLKGSVITQLYCNDNSNLRLVNIPSTIVDGNYSNNLITLDSDTLDFVVMQNDYKKKLDEYFKLKNNYEKEVTKAYRKANSKMLDTNREKNPKKLMQKLRDFKTPKAMPPCKGCGKNGGMSFTITSEVYGAQCANNPKCDWKLAINRALFENREFLIYEYISVLENLKTDFIQSKMNSLFRYFSDDSIKKTFEEQMKSYQLCGGFLKTLTDAHNHIYYNEDKKKLIQGKEREINALLEQVKSKLVELSEENEESVRKIILDDIVRIQDKEIRPIVEYIRLKRYEYTKMLYENDKNEYILCTKEVLAEKLDTLLSGAMTVSNTEKPEKNAEPEKEIDWGDEDDEDDINV